MMNKSSIGIQSNCWHLCDYEGLLELKKNQMLVLVDINSPEEADYLCKDPPNQLKES